MSGEMSEKTSDKSESELPALEGTRERLESVGITLNENERSGVFMQVDQSPEVISKARDGVEVMPLSQAMEKYPWVAELRWSLVDRDKDEYTKMADSSEGVEGYFIRALPGAKVEIPVEACLYLKTAGHIQKVHNILIAEEGSELNVISGCASHPGVISGMHVGVSEFFVRKDAKLNFTMIHRWDSDIEVRPRSAAFVDEGGTFISNYVIMGPVKLVQLYPRVRVKKDGMAVFSNIVVAPEGSMVDVGSYAALEEPGASVDMISRVISNGGKMITRGHIVAESNDVNGHLECRGLMLSKEGVIDAIPEIETHLPRVEISHEAAIGKIAEEAVFYLMCRGLTRDEAVGAIIRGFLDIEIKGLPDTLKVAITRVIDSLGEEML